MERKKVWKYDKKTLIYMGITAICLLACIFLMVRIAVYGIKRLPVHNPYSIDGAQHIESPDTSVPGGGKELRINGDDAALAIEDGLSGILPLKGTKVSFNDDCTAGISGIASRSDIERLIENGGIDAPPLIKIAIGLLPEEVTLSAILGIELDTKTGRLNAPLQGLKISGIDIDTGFLPENSESAISDALNGFAGEGGSIRSFEIKNGVMILRANL